MFAVAAEKMLGLTIAWYLLTVPQEEPKTPVICPAGRCSTLAQQLTSTFNSKVPLLRPRCTLAVPALYPR